MPTPFPDRSDTLFGRAPDLAYLLARTERPGVTFLFGPSQMGKSTLLKEVARRRSQPVPDTFLGPKACLPGYTESQGQSEDLFLRAVADLYTRWITSSSFAEQARAVSHQQQKDFIGRFGEGVGSLFEKVSKLGGSPAETVGGIVRTTLEKLAQANRDLQSGGLQLTPLSLDQGRNLLTMVYTITQRPILLILDQWEKSRLPADADLLETLVRHLDDWPPCHILVGAIPLPAPQAAADSLQSGFPYEVESHLLPVMHLDDPTAAADLLASVRARVPAAAELDDASILDLISGHPEVVNRWTKREPITTVARMKQLADEAQTHRFSELKALLTLPDAQRILAMRLALLPAGNAPDAWADLKPLFIDSIQPSELDQLTLKGFVEPSSTTFFGHSKRAEVALQTFTRTFPNDLAAVADHLSVSLAANIPDASAEVIPFARALLRLHSLASTINLSPFSRVLGQAASSISSQGAIIEWNDYLVARKARPADFNKVAALLAMGLLHALNHTSQTDYPTRRDEMLEELRALAAACPQQATVQQEFAKGLLNTVIDALAENRLVRADQLLVDLRALGSAFPQDPVLCEPVAIGLFNSLFHARKEGSLTRRDSLLNDLRALHKASPGFPILRGWFAGGLFNEIEQHDSIRREKMLDELSALANAYPQDALVREQLAKGLINTLFYARNEHNLSRPSFLLKDLQTLAKAFPEDAAVRKRLADGLFVTLNDAQRENALTRRDELLDELNILAKAFPEDANVQRQLAGAVYNTFLSARPEEDRSRLDPLVDELCTVARANPAQETAQQQLAGVLVRRISEAGQAGNLALRNELLEELIAIFERTPSNPDIREALAIGLSNALQEARQEQDLTFRTRLLDKSRQLATASPDDATVHKWLAKGYFTALMHATEEEESLTARDEIFNELRTLAHPFLHIATAREWLVRGIAVALVNARQAAKSDSETALRIELQALVKQYPDDELWSSVAFLLEPDWSEEDLAGE